jgi:hypothetical protein
MKMVTANMLYLSNYSHCLVSNGMPSSPLIFTLLPCHASVLIYFSLRTHVYRMEVSIHNYRKLSYLNNH